MLGAFRIKSFAIILYRDQDVFIVLDTLYNDPGGLAVSDRIAILWH
nr:hypothetical protein [Paraflavitalea speifideiaquila]